MVGMILPLQCLQNRYISFKLRRCRRNELLFWSQIL